MPSVAIPDPPDDECDLFRYHGVPIHHSACGAVLLHRPQPSFPRKPCEMGEFKFRIPEYWEFEKRHAACVHVIGLDGMPSQCRIQIDGRILTIMRSRNESGKVYCPFPFEQFGELLVATGSLPERDQPYSLVIELARGTLNRLNNQYWIWREGGLDSPSGFFERQQTATNLLAESVFTSDDAAADQLARQSIETAMEAIFQLGSAFAEKVVPLREAETSENPFWMAACIRDADQLNDVISSQAADLIEFECAPQEPHDPADAAHADTTPVFPCDVVLGPLLDASPGGRVAPTEMFDDFDSRKRQILLDCRGVLDRAPAETAMLHLACGLNGIGHRQLSYPQQLRLLVDLLNLVDDHSIAAPVMISFDYPWGERLAWSVGGTHPLQVADSLLRQAVAVSYLGLDINLDYWPGGSIARDPFQWLDLVDIWSQFGLPLVLCLRIPECVEAPLAGENSRNGHNEVRAGSTSAQRLQLLEHVLPMMLARPMVAGIIFRQWSDSDDPRFPCGGLVTTDDQAKEILARLRDMRSRWKMAHSSERSRQGG